MSRGDHEELCDSTNSGVDNATEIKEELMDPASDHGPHCHLATEESPFHMAPTLDLYCAAQPQLAQMWADPDSSDVPVRGASYMTDQLKVAAGPSVASLVHFDLWTTTTPEQRHHVARVDLQRDGANSVIRSCAQQFPNALVFILNIELPDDNNVSLVTYWLVPGYFNADRNDKANESFYRLLRRFCEEEEESDGFRDARFKLIPRFTQAPWLLNSLVQSRPAITGKKLTQKYFREENYMEVDLDISSSTLSHYIGSMCQNWAAYIEVDVFITIQGEQDDEELPERILGGVRLSYMDLALAQPIPNQQQH